MRMLQSALTQQIDAANIPVVGTQLSRLSSFLQTMDRQVTARWRMPRKSPPRPCRTPSTTPSGPRASTGW